jgi:sigma-B regulation protein RsbQ
VMQSRDDNLAPERVGRWLADTLPHGRYVLMDATGHCPHISAPTEVARVLQAHLAWRG